LNIPGAARLILTKSNVDVNAITQTEAVPLHFAVQQRALEIVIMLLDHPDIKIGELDRKGETPLDHAIRLPAPEIVAVLEARGAPQHMTKRNKNFPIK
jgi:ankyrin repeat protein